MDQANHVCVIEHGTKQLLSSFHQHRDIIDLRRQLKAARKGLST
jgi:hypothetical protein